MHFRVEKVIAEEEKTAKNVIIHKDGLSRLAYICWMFVNAKYLFHLSFLREQLVLE